MFGNRNSSSKKDPHRGRIRIPHVLFRRHGMIIVPATFVGVLVVVGQSVDMLPDVRLVS